jgi:hypothetical protein
MTAYDAFIAGHKWKEEKKKTPPATILSAISMMDLNHAVSHMERFNDPSLLKDKLAYLRQQNEKQWVAPPIIPKINHI